MILNDRQYKITKAQARKFEEAIRNIEKESDLKVHPIILKANKDALMSQLEDLTKEIEEYEYLKSGEENKFALKSFDELPKVLIKARIANGLSQKDLANLLGIKEQQIQRYEATEYESASLTRINEVVNALHLEIPEGFIVKGNSLSPQKIFEKLKSIGLNEDFILRRLIPDNAVEQFRTDKNVEIPIVYANKIGSYISKVFGWTLTDLTDGNTLSLNINSSCIPAYKSFKNAKKEFVDAYTVYAHYLALLLLETTSGTKQKSIPSDPKIFLKDVIKQYGKLSFKNTLLYTWDLGIPVLPLRDSGAFHGACWRVDNRNVIVLKQRTKSSARWLFDLLHELFHASQNLGTSNMGIVEEDEFSENKRKLEEEINASSFAGDVMLNGKAEDLVRLCVKRAKGKIEYLKKALPDIACENNVPVDYLANYMAFRLSLQGENWWGTANNLQRVGLDPWGVARDILLENVNLYCLNDIDKSILLKALTNEEV